MTQTDNFEKPQVSKFSHGPEKDTSIELSHALDSFLNDLPALFRELLELEDAFTVRQLMEAYEDQIRSALEEGKKIGEDAATYEHDYAAWGWQYDETPLVADGEEVKAVISKRKEFLRRRLASDMRLYISVAAAEAAE